jgi:hypothetical protein
MFVAAVSVRRLVGVLAAYEGEGEGGGGGEGEGEGLLERPDLSEDVAAAEAAARRRGVHGRCTSTCSQSG